MCDSVTIGQQVICDRCGLTWDIDDDEPPECLSDDEVKRRRGFERLDGIRDKLNQPCK